MTKRRRKKTKLQTLPDELIGMMDATYEVAADMPDGAWWAMLENTVEQYNEEFNANLEENTAVHSYLHQRVSE